MMQNEICFTIEAKDLPQIVHLDSLELLLQVFNVYFSRQSDMSTVTDV